MKYKRILAIDVGLKRCGLAWTDPLQICVQPLKGVATDALKETLQTLFQQEPITKVVIGYPSSSQDKALLKKIHEIRRWITLHFPWICVDFQEEWGSSKEALQKMIQAGKSKKFRQNKTHKDILSAVLVLQRYLKHV